MSSPLVEPHRDGTVIDRLNTSLADRYRIERELGAGGMATVYLARDLKHDRDVAIKVLRAAAIGDRDAALAFARTAFEIRDPSLPISGTSAMSATLQEMPEFRAILASMGLSRWVTRDVSQ